MNKIRFVEVKDQVLTARTVSLVSLERPDSFTHPPPTQPKEKFVVRPICVLYPLCWVSV